MIIWRAANGRGADQCRAAAVSDVPPGHSEGLGACVDGRFQCGGVTVPPKHETRSDISRFADTADILFIQSIEGDHAAPPVPCVMRARCILQCGARESRRKAVDIDTDYSNCAEP